MRVVRPVVRSFKWPHLEPAAAWVRAGGHAVVWIAPRKARLVFARPKGDDWADLGYWSALDMGRTDYRLAKRGPFEGMAFVPVPHDCYAIVRDRVRRDSIHPDATRALDLDCLACGSCCKDNRVELDDVDLERFAKAGRPELAKPPYARREDGSVVLVLRKDKRCKHLGGDNKCGIYAIRPDSCRVFLVGSECCLSSREEEMGILDGAAE
ncbi:MAG TPA: YkgJ family cysteine cluster protein [Polyangiaceae bacterium]